MRVSFLTVRRSEQAWKSVALFFLSLILIAASFVPMPVRAQDLQLMEAINAVMMGNPTPMQEALVVFHNRDINRLALRGKISDAAYQASQKHFAAVNNNAIRDSAKAAGLSAKLQPSAGGKHNPGTDTDVLAEAMEPGKKLTLEDFQAADEAHQTNLRRYLKRKGFDAPPGRIEAETDFMPVRSSVTDEEFTRINRDINRRGGTAYTRPGAADIEFQMRTMKNNPGVKLNLLDTSEYVSQMQELAQHKFHIADGMEAKANQLMKTNPNAAEDLLADAQLLRSQGAKYLQRIDNLTNAVAEQHGLPKIDIPVDSRGRISPDSLDRAVRNIDKNKRGVMTADDAAMVGELGELGVGKGILNYTRKLSEIGATQPSKLEAIQAIIAEQAGNLNPTMREALLIKATQAYEAAGGTPYGKITFLKKLQALASDPEALAAAKARVAGGVGAAPFELPAGVAAGARVAGAVGGVLGVATVYLDYQACIESGKTQAQCDEELKHTLKTTVIVGAGMFATAKGLIAAGIISQSTLVAVGAGMAFVGVPMAVYAAYSAGINWANAPEKNALTQQYAMEKDLLMRYGQSAAVAQSELNLMAVLRSAAVQMCMKMVNRGRATKVLMDTSNVMAAQWKESLGETIVASDSCEGQRERMERVSQLSQQSSEGETKAIAQLDEANALGEKCTSAEQADRIRQLMESSNMISAQMIVDAAEARGYNNKIGHQDEAALEQRVKLSEAMRDRMFANKKHLSTQLAEMRELQSDMHAMITAYSEARQTFVRHFGLMSQAHPKQTPSPLYNLEFLNANAQQAKLSNQFDGFQEVLECTAGDSEATKLLTADSIVDNQYEALEDRHNQLRDEAKPCKGVERQDKAVDDMSASANWVQAAVDINSPLLQKADACKRKFKGKSASAAKACPANAVSVWNPDQQKNLCQCAQGFKLGADQKSCEPKNEPVVIACNTTTKAGTNPPQTIVVNVGHNAGTAQFQYEMFDVPDHMIVQYGGQVLADTGCVSGRKSLPLALSGASEQVTIVVQPACRKSERTEWNFTLSCPVADKGSATGTQSFAPGGPSQILLETVTGQAMIVLGTGATPQSLTAGINLTIGAQLQTAADGQLVMKSPNETRLTLGQNSQLRLGEPNADKQFVKLERGTLDIYHDKSGPGRDDVAVTMEYGNVVGLDTRYRMVRDDRGTEVFVYEGSVRLRGRYIYRTYAPNVEAGKPSPVKEMILHAGERALIVDTDMSAPSDTAANTPSGAVVNGTSPNATGEVASVPPRWSNPQRPGDDRLAEVVSILTPVTREVRKPPVTPEVVPQVAPQTPGRGVADRVAPPATSVLNTPDPWNDPRVQSLIDQWLHTATPVIAASRPGNFSYSEWGQIKGPGITIAGAPDHPAGWSRYQSMWAVRMKFDSLNLCTLGEFVERQIAGKSMDGCQKAVTKPKALPDWLAPSAPPAQPVSNRGEEALTLARTAVNRREADVAAAQDFSGEWGCEVREGSESSALFPTITRSGNSYTVSTITSGVEGMLKAHTVRLEGGKLIAVHAFQVTNGTLTISLTKTGSKLSGTYQAVRVGYPTETLPITQCEQVPEASSVATPSTSTMSSSARPAPVAQAKVSTLLDQIAAIPDADWVGSKPPLGSDGRSVFALVSEVNDKRTNACAYEAKRKGWNVVGFSSRMSLQHAQYPSAPNFPLILGSKARDMIYTIHMAAGRKDVPIPFATAYLIDPSGRITQQGICYEMLKIDFGVSDGKK
ncbi:MAG: FecR domain-containing protein [Burkholderiales bacterium]|nr:FecR domain-containing protein [Burkholderiales bacterium]